MDRAWLTSLAHDWSPGLWRADWDDGARPGRDARGRARHAPLLPRRHGGPRPRHGPHRAADDGHLRHAVAVHPARAVRRPRRLVRRAAAPARDRGRSGTGRTSSGPRSSCRWSWPDCGGRRERAADHQRSRRGDLAVWTFGDGPRRARAARLPRPRDRHAEPGARRSPRAAIARSCPRFPATRRRPYPPTATCRWRAVARDMVGLLDHLGIDRAHVVGHDWGGIVGYRLGAEHAERLASLTALAVLPRRRLRRAPQRAPRAADRRLRVDPRVRVGPRGDRRRPRVHHRRRERLVAGPAPRRLARRARRC